MLTFIFTLVTVVLVCTLLIGGVVLRQANKTNAQLRAILQDIANIREENSRCHAETVTRLNKHGETLAGLVVWASAQAQMVLALNNTTSEVKGSLNTILAESGGILAVRLDNGQTITGQSVDELAEKIKNTDAFDHMSLDDLKALLDMKFRETMDREGDDETDEPWKTN